ncbi:MAG: response regulator [Desulfuromonadales bacterium]|nr:response regulator [Desulfuromonadales bacterium]
MNARGENISLLYIEDEAIVRENMLEFLNRRFDKVWVAENGAEGLETYRKKAPDIVLTDIRMPVMGGLEMARAILEFDDKAIIIVTSAHNESNYLLEAIEMGVNNYLLKPLEWNKVDATLQRCIERVLKTRNARDLENLQTEEAFHYTITSLARAAEANDEDNGNHILRVGEYSAAICRSIGFPKQLVDTIVLQSQLHDVGKIHVAPEILKKPGKLTNEEMELVREHTVFGARIIGSHPRLETAKSIALHHHEHWDGTGYPYGLAMIEIPVVARIVAIADVYDALRNQRIYKTGFDHDTACSIILEGDGRTEPSHFDPFLLEAFKKIERELEAIYGRLATVK